MSYFMVINGSKPDLNDITTIRVRPLQEDQKYVIETIHRIFPDFEARNTFSISDYTGTMDLLPYMHEQVCLGKSFRSALFGKFIIRCMNTGCKIFVWWADTADPGNIDKYLEKTSEQEDMIECILRQQNRDGYVCAFYEPEESS